MAKQIKAIKCPHCGSVEKIKQEKDLYRCVNCNTDYFLDNDDVNINVMHHNNSTANPGSSSMKPVAIILATIIGFSSLWLLVNSFSSDSTPSRVTTSGSRATPSAPQVPVVRPPSKPEQPKPNTYRMSMDMYYLMITDDNDVYSVGLGYRTYARDGAELNGYYFVVKDINSGKTIREQQIKEAGKTQYSDFDKDWDYRKFPDGNIYFTHGQSKVFKLDTSDLTFTDVTNSIFANHSEFGSGIATINLAPWGYEDCFYLLGNNGQEYYYYPLKNNVYSAYSNDLRKYFNLLNKQRETADKPYIRTLYYFGKNGRDTYLIKVVYKTDSIKENETFAITRRSGSDRPFELMAVRGGEKPDWLIEDKDLTPGRLYFNPSVIYSDHKTLIIKTKASAAPAAEYILQSLDIDTGDIKWTLREDKSKNLDLSTLVLLTERKLYEHNVLVPYAKGYVIQSGYGKYTLLDSDGNITKSISLDN